MRVLRLRRIEFNVIRHLPFCRDYTDVARSSGVSLSSVPRVLSSLRSKFLLRALFDLNSMGFSLGLFKVRFSEELYQKPIPFVLEKIPVSLGKSELSLLLLALCPAGRCSDVADILKSEEYTSLAGRFLWRSDMPRDAVLDGGYLRVNFDSIREIMEREISPRISAPVKRKPDYVDLWITAELMRDPFVRLSKKAEEMGLKQQTASYHYNQHVRPLHLFNVLTPKFRSLRVPGILLELHTSRESSEQVAWGLSLHPMIRETLVSEDGRVYVLSYIQGSDLFELYRFLEESELVKAFTYRGVLIHEVLEYTLPFGDAFREDPYNLEVMYEAIYTPRQPKPQWHVYRIGDEQALGQ
ncbi:hypothetical protein IG193_02675 [Infirmifilum lucidum]|uniref:Uncharacterized protein n=1 Tax=Infirmifilum lucidum TaxID=2776706 RepID=A0A7L9FKC0_9CREN|nr:hypothetical protein [Infirmifilum lucidum]QOJ79384.1 hypothetical protein IG193_02675 [Infirmifilum lucidum]